MDFSIFIIVRQIEKKQILISVRFLLLLDLVIIIKIFINFSSFFFLFQMESAITWWRNQNSLRRCWSGIGNDHNGIVFWSSSSHVFTISESPIFFSRNFPCFAFLHYVEVSYWDQKFVDSGFVKTCDELVFRFFASSTRCQY